MMSIFFIPTYLLAAVVDAVLERQGSEEEEEEEALKAV